jgi:transcriptional regulator with XRE-family HTH domain
MFERAAAQLVRAVRGRRSQVAFARRLGFRANPVTDWEHGRRWPTAELMLRACARSGIDVPAAFSRFHPAEPLPVKRPQEWDLARWLDRMRGRSGIGEVAGRAGFSRFAVARWLKGRSRPLLPDFLRLVDATTGRLPDLVAELVPIDQVPELVPRHAAAQAARNVAFEAPWSEAILRLLETRAYQALPRHEVGWLARRLGIPEEEETRVLSLLTTAAIIERRRRKWVPAGVLTVDTRGRPEALRELRTHWARVGLERAGAPSALDSFSYNVCSLSTADRERVRQLLRAAFREIRSIVAASEPTESVALVILQLVALGEG